jgi:hypothetical protein
MSEILNLDQKLRVDYLNSKIESLEKRKKLGPKGKWELFIARRELKEYLEDIVFWHLMKELHPEVNIK